MAKAETANKEPLEKQLWKVADKLGKNIGAAEYKHVVLGLIFLKYIPDSFEARVGRISDSVMRRSHCNWRQIRFSERFRMSAMG